MLGGAVRWFFRRKRRHSSDTGRSEKTSSERRSIEDIPTDDLNIDLFVWRPILAGALTFYETETICDINDIADANEALDLKNEAIERLYNETKDKGKWH